MANSKWTNFRKVTPYLFLSPYLLFFILFMAVPMCMSVVISFTDWNYVEPMAFVGLKNYKFLFGLVGTGFVAGQFWESVLHTLLFVAVESPLLILIPLGVALMLNHCKKAQKILMSIFYFPAILSITTVCMIWFFLLDTNVGLINTMLGESIPWITKLPYAWVSIFLLSTWWGIGGNMVLYMAALGNVPRDLTEAAMLDGANAGQRFLHVTFPSIRRTFLYVSVMTVLASFNVFGQPDVLTNGGPDNATTVAVMSIYNTAFGSGNKFGRATAMCIVLGVIMMAFTVTSYRLQVGEDD